MLSIAVTKTRAQEFKDKGEVVMGYTGMTCELCSRTTYYNEKLYRLEKAFAHIDSCVQTLCPDPKSSGKIFSAPVSAGLASGRSAPVKSQEVAKCERQQAKRPKPAPQGKPHKPNYTIDQAAKKLKISKATLYRRIQADQIQTGKVNGKTVVFLPNLEGPYSKVKPAKQATESVKTVVARIKTDLNLLEKLCQN